MFARKNFPLSFPFFSHFHPLFSVIFGTSLYLGQHSYLDEIWNEFSHLTILFLPIQKNSISLHLFSSFLCHSVFYSPLYRFLAFFERFIPGYLIVFYHCKQKFKNSILKYILTCKVYFILYVDLVRNLLLNYLVSSNSLRLDSLEFPRSTNMSLTIKA